MNLGPKWSPYVWKTATATDPGYHFNKLYDHREKAHANNTKSKNKPEAKWKRWKRKMSSSRQANTKKARKSYGPEAMDVTPDLTTEELGKAK